MPGDIGTGTAIVSTSILIETSIITKISTVNGTRSSMAAEKASGSIALSTGKAFRTEIKKQLSSITGQPQEMQLNPVKIFAARRRPAEKTLPAMVPDRPRLVIQETGRRLAILVPGHHQIQGTGHRPVIRFPGNQIQGLSPRVVT